MPACPDLRALYADKYRISRDEAFDSLADPWSHQIPGRCGNIYPLGDGLLAVDVNYHPAAARKVAALPGVRVHQDGGWGGEMTLVFPLDLFDKVPGIVNAKRLPGPRQLSDEHRAELARFQFQSRCSEQPSVGSTGLTTPEGG